MPSPTETALHTQLLDETDQTGDIKNREIPNGLAVFRALVERCASALAFIAAVCLFLMMAQIVIDVVLKFGFNTPIQGNLEIVSFYYMVAVVFLPLAMVELRHEHISVDLFFLMLPNLIRQLVYAAGSLVTALFFALLTYQTFLDAVNATRVGEVMMGTNFVPIWPSRWALPAGFLVICLATILHTCRALLERDDFDPTPASPEVGGEPN